MGDSKRLAQLEREFAELKLKSEKAEKKAEEAERKAEEERKAKEEAERKAEEERKAKEEAERKAEEERKAKEEERKAREAAEKKAEKAEQRAKEAEEGTDFYALKLPPAVCLSGGSSAVRDAEHEDAKTLKFSFLPFEIPPNPEPKHTPLFGDSLREGFLPVGSEGGVQKFVSVYVDAAMASAGLKDVITPYDDFYVARYRPDILVIFNENNIPCGVVEIKKPLLPHQKTLQSPKEDPIVSARFQGQMFNYLALLKTVFGVQNPIGIMTTYDSWRFCCLKGAVNNERVFHATDPIAFDHPDIHRYVISALVKMKNSQVVGNQPLAADSFYLTVEPSRFVWSELGANKLNDDEFPASNSKCFYLLSQLGRGAEGKIWLACNSSHRRCALKTFKVTRDTKQALLQAEADAEVEVWRTVFGVKEVFKVDDLAGAPAIVMPLLTLPPTKKLRDGKVIATLTEEEKTAVRQAIKVYVEKGHSATDFKWDHVGFLRGQAILFDTRPQPCQDRQKAEGDMLTILGL